MMVEQFSRVKNKFEKCNKINEKINNDDNENSSEYNGLIGWTGQVIEVVSNRRQWRITSGMGSSRWNGISDFILSTTPPLTNNPITRKTEWRLRCTYFLTWAMMGQKVHFWGDDLCPGDSNGRSALLCWCYSATGLAGQPRCEPFTANCHLARTTLATINTAHERLVVTLDSPIRIITEWGVNAPIAACVNTRLSQMGTYAAAKFGIRFQVHDSSAIVDSWRVLLKNGNCHGGEIPLRTTIWQDLISHNEYSEPWFFIELFSCVPMFVL